MEKEPSKTFEISNVRELDYSHDLPGDLKPAVEKADRNLAGAIWTIVWGVALPCIPIIIITSILLYFIFHYRIVLSPGWPGLLPEVVGKPDKQSVTNVLNFWRKEGGNRAYYVQYNTSTITTVASLAGRIIPYLSSSIMALVAFFAARHLIVQSKHRDGNGLPAPEQLTLLISMLSGSSFGPLKDTLVYRFGKKEKLMHPLPAAFASLLLITMLGLLIPIIDSWFGIATTTIAVTQLSPRNASISNGRGLTDICNTTFDEQANTPYPGSIETHFWPCHVALVPGYPIPVLGDVSDASRTAMGSSPKNTIRNYTDTQSSNIRGNMTYFYVGSPEQNALIDFRAKTYAATTTCAPMTRKCLPGGEESKVFNCTPAFTGNVMQNVLNRSAQNDIFGISTNVGIAFAKDPGLTEAGDVYHGTGDRADNSISWSLPIIYQTNPLYFGAWAKGYPPIDVTGAQQPYGNDTGIIYEWGIGDGGIWLVNCSATIYDVEYTWVNGSVAEFNATPSSSDMAALVSGAFTFLMPMPEYNIDRTFPAVQTALMASASVAGNGNNSVDIANIFGREMSKNLMAFSIGALEPKLNLLEQERNANIIVARIPLVPLYLLLATKALYVIAVIMLAIGAYCFTHPAETEVFKAQLSVKGLAAAHLTSPELRQENVARVLQSQFEVADKTEAGKPLNNPETVNTAGRHHRNNSSLQQNSLVNELRKQPNLQYSEISPVQDANAQQYSPPNTRFSFAPDTDGKWRRVALPNSV